LLVVRAVCRHATREEALDLSGAPRDYSIQQRRVAGCRFDGSGGVCKQYEQLQ